MILDTSTALMYVAFVQNNQVIYEKKQFGKNNHSEHFLLAIEEGLKHLSWQVKDFGAIIVGIGPGSYTGLRISLTVAKIWAWTLQIPLYTVSSLDLLASGYYHQNGLYAVVSLAKSGHVYGKVLKAQDGSIRPFGEESFMEKTAFLDSIKHLNYSLVDEQNYLVDIRGLKPELVQDLHNLSPYYMRRGI